MTFLCNTTTTNNQTCFLKNKKNYVLWSLPLTGLENRAVEFDLSPNNNSIYYPERPCLYTSHYLKGSITIEAAICFPIFLVAIVSLISIINIMYLQTDIQIALENAVQKASKVAYDSNVITAAYIYNTFLSDETRALLDKSPIKNGSKGISFLSSTIDTQSGIGDIVLTYTVTIPFIPESIISLRLSNRCYIHLFTGRDLDKKLTPKEEYVYYTTRGKVFHFDRYCQYLLNYSEALPYADIDKTLLPCKLCETLTLEQLKESNPIVYITPSNYCFHTTVKCSSFTGNVFRIKYSTLDKNTDICERCMKGK